MVKVKQFKEGDKVFAKVKGYPAWPALVVGKAGKKFNVQFYGTGETGSIKPEDLYYYLKNKEQFVAKGAQGKRKDFLEAVSQIDEAIGVGGTDGDDLKQESEEETTGKRKRSTSSSRDSQANKKVSRDSSLDNQEDSTDTMGGKGAADKTNDTPKAVEEDTEMPFIPNMTLLSEANLKNWVLYADHVKEAPELYKAKPVEPRDHSENQVFPFKTGDRLVAIKIHKTWPLEFANEYDFSMYDYEAAARALMMKDAIVKGQLQPENDPESFVQDFAFNEWEVKKDIEMKLVNNKYRRVERLRREATLVELDAKVKNCLGLGKADPKKAITHLNGMLELKFDDITLKKHHHVVEMIRRLRKYIGNLAEWQLSEEEVVTFNADAKKVREKADEVYRKFKAILQLPEESPTFWESFQTSVHKFKEDCKYLTNREVFTMCGDPYARFTIIDRLEQDEDLEEIEVPQPATETAAAGEKENSDNSSEVPAVETKVEPDE